MALKTQLIFNLVHDTTMRLLMLNSFQEHQSSRAFHSNEVHLSAYLKVLTHSY